MSIGDLSTSLGFWEIGSYKTNVRRIKEGLEQIEDFSKMAKERAEIEAKYGKSLQMFAEKWKGHVDRNVYEGALKRAWMELIGESDALAIQHGRVRDRLLDEIVRTLALYRKENHHPSAFRSPKEIREIEEGFEKSQKQWKKLFDKVENAKKNYHMACRNEKSAFVLVTNAQQDTSLSLDAKQKMKDRHVKAQEEVLKTKESYEKHLSEINQYRGAYIENMSFVFEKCQIMEMKRLKFFIEMIAGEQQVLADLIRNARFAQMHSTLESLLKSSDEPCLNRDLKEWSSKHGVDAPAQWPTFEEYTPEMRQISGKQNAKDTGGVILTKQIIKNDDAIVPGPANSYSSDNGKHKDSDSDTNTFDSRRTDSKHSKVHAAHNDDSSLQNGDHKLWGDNEFVPATTPDSAKFGDFDDENTHKGSMATVLYDYVPMEEDEIALKKGQTIELLSEPDSLGWCTGRNGAHTGLFPASYVQAL